MKIIWIINDCPYPANTGGRIAIWKRIEYMAKRNEIYLYTIIDDKQDRNGRDEMLKYCKEVRFYERRKVTPLFLLSCLFAPYPAISRWNRQMKQDIQRKYREEKIDYIIVDFPQMLGVLPGEVRNTGKIILHQHNMEYKVAGDIAKTIKNPVLKCIHSYSAARLKAYERSCYKQDYIWLYTFVSESDMEAFSRQYKKTNLYLMPIGADLNVLPVQAAAKNIVFIGKMSYEPNIEGALWFIENCWADVKRQVPEAALYFVGKDPADKIIKAAAGRTDVYVTGTVPSVEEYYQKAALVIVPLRTGGGVKVKLLEALGYGKIVVSTSKGIEGTSFQPQIDVAIADEPADFVHCCVDILTDPQKYEMMRQNAMDKIQNQYSWEAIVSNFENLLLADAGSGQNNMQGGGACKS